MIGADEVREAGGFVDPLGGADDQRDASQVARPASPQSGRSYTGLTPATNSAPTSPRDELGAQLGQLRVAARALIRRARQIDRGAVGADRLVDEIAEHLDAHVLASRDHQAAAARRPQPIGDRRRAPRPTARRRVRPPRTASPPAARASPPGASRRARSRRARRAAGDRHSTRSATAAIRSARDTTWSATVSLDPPPARVAARELHRRDPRAEEIGVEADDDVGLIEAVVRHHARRHASARARRGSPTPRSDRR